MVSSDAARCLTSSQLGLKQKLPFHLETAPVLVFILLMSQCNPLLLTQTSVFSRELISQLLPVFLFIFWDFFKSSLQQLLPGFATTKTKLNGFGIKYNFKNNRKLWDIGKMDELEFRVEMCVNPVTEARADENIQENKIDKTDGLLKMRCKKSGHDTHKNRVIPQLASSELSWQSLSPSQM